MLREWINSVIVRYNEIDRVNANRNNGWIDFQILTIVVFMTLHESFFKTYEEKDLLQEIENTLLEYFVEWDGNPDSSMVRIVGYWIPQHNEEINSIYLEMLSIYSGRWRDRSEQTQVFELLIYYPFLGKLFQMKQNNGIDYTKKAQEILGAFFDADKNEYKQFDAGQVLDKMQKCLSHYAFLGGEMFFEGKKDIGEYCRMGKIWEDL